MALCVYLLVYLKFLAATYMWFENTLAIEMLVM